MRARGIPHRATVPGSVWAVSGVRNEQDVIGGTLRHLLDQGVAGIIVADNGSTDDTPAILAEFASRAPVYVVDDREPAFHQPEKVSYLAHLAWRAGADWIVPFDADEHWYAPGASLADHLAGTNATVARALMHDVLPVGDTLAFADDEDVLILARTFPDAGYIEKKVAFRSGRGIHVLAGNHEVARGGERADELHILHYQWRSLAQRTRKARAGAVAHASTGNVERGTHWFALATLDDDAMARSWDRVRRDAEFAPEWVRERAPWRSWRTWDPAGAM